MWSANGDRSFPGWEMPVFWRWAIRWKRCSIWPNITGNHVRAEVVGITGSNGKTVVKEWLYQLLADEEKVYRSPRSYNSQVGVPLSLLGIEENIQTAIIEAGISKPGEMERLQRMIRPEIGIFTHLGDAHGENFSSLQQKLEEKSVLFRDCQCVIGRAGESMQYIASVVGPDAVVLTWGKAGSCL